MSTPAKFSYLPPTRIVRCIRILLATAIVAGIASLPGIDAQAAEPPAVPGLGAADEPLFLPPPAATHGPPSDADTIEPLPPVSGAESELPTCGPRQSTVWLVNTRNRRGCEFDPQVSRYCRCHGWNRSSLDDFYAHDNPAVLTLVFVHGNDNDAQFAVEQGLDVYNRLCAAGCGQIPIRFVIWSWPSQQVIRPYTRDVRYKATLTDPEATLLAPFLADIRSDVPVSVVGYSYGARIATGALHLLGGGTLDFGENACLAQPRQVPIRLALISAAMERDWLLPDGHHGCALSQVDCVWMTVNNDDIALKFFPWLCGPGDGQPALGYVGPGRVAGYEALRDKFCVMNVSHLVAHRHRLKFYLESPPFMRSLFRAAVAGPAGNTIASLPLDSARD